MKNLSFNDLLNIIYSNLKNINLSILLLVFIVIIFIWCILEKKTPNQLNINNVSNYKISSFEKKTSKGEEICRDVAQKIFKKPFKSVRPNFLRNPYTNKNLELDCYNEDLRIAIEYDGKQHSEYSPYFHRNGPKDFVNQVKRDLIKNKLCKQNNIFLIRVPHFIPFNKIKDFIIHKLKQNKRL